MHPKFDWTPDHTTALLIGLKHGLQQWRIAEALGTTVRVIERHIRELKDMGVDVPTQRTGPRSGEGHPEWKGGRSIDKHGYVLVYAPWHPSVRQNGRASGGRYITEHRLVMEQKLGRLLTREEVVHHINGDPADNRPENLEVFAKNSDHLRHELTGKCPQWTPEGKARILASIRRRRGKRCPSTEPDAAVTPETAAHSIESPEPSEPDPSETE